MRNVIFLLLLIGGLLNVQASSGGYPSLWECQSPELQEKLDQLIKDMKLTRSVQQGRLAIVVVDITDPHKPELAAVNPNKMLYAASLPKIAILLGAFVQIESGQLKPDAALWQDMTDMIRSSSNEAATRVLDKVGREQLLEILQSPRFQLYDPAHNGGLWVGKDYAKAGAYKRDPLYNLSHAATVMQAARFYYLLETNRLVGPELTEKMKEMLSRPALEHKFVKGLKEVPDAKVYRKSGTWMDYHADSALVEVEDRTFIIVGLAQSKKGSKWLVELAQPLIQIVKG